MPPFGPDTAEWVRETAKWLLGMEIPSANPPAMRRLADHKDHVAATLEELKELLTLVRRKVRTDFSGTAADYYDASIAQFTTGDNDYIGSGAKTARNASTVLRDGAANAEHSHWMAFGQLVQLILEIAWCIAMAQWTMGASRALIPWFKYIRSIAIQRILTWLTLTVPSHQITEQLFASLDSIVQRVQIDAGTRRFHDTEMTRLTHGGAGLSALISAGFSGAVDGLFSHQVRDLLRTNLDTLADVPPPPRIDTPPPGRPDTTPTPAPGAGVPGPTPAPVPEAAAPVPDLNINRDLAGVFAAYERDLAATFNPPAGKTAFDNPFVNSDFRDDLAGVFAAHYGSALGATGARALGSGYADTLMAHWGRPDLTHRLADLLDATPLPSPTRTHLAQTIPTALTHGMGDYMTRPLVKAEILGTGAASGALEGYLGEGTTNALLTDQGWQANGYSATSGAFQSTFQTVTVDTALAAIDHVQSPPAPLPPPDAETTTGSTTGPTGPTGINGSTNENGRESDPVPSGRSAPPGATPGTHEAPDTPSTDITRTDTAPAPSDTPPHALGDTGAPHGRTGSGGEDSTRTTTSDGTRGEDLHTPRTVPPDPLAPASEHPDRFAPTAVGSPTGEQPTAPGHHAPDDPRTPETDSGATPLTAAAPLVPPVQQHTPNTSASPTTGATENGTAAPGTPADTRNRPGSTLDPAHGRDGLRTDDHSGTRAPAPTDTRSADEPSVRTSSTASPADQGEHNGADHTPGPADHASDTAPESLAHAPLSDHGHTPSAHADLPSEVTPERGGSEADRPPQAGSSRSSEDASAADRGQPDHGATSDSGRESAERNSGADTGDVPPREHGTADGDIDGGDDDFYSLSAPAPHTTSDPDDPWNGNPPTSLDLSALTAGGKDTKSAGQPFTVGEAVADLADPGYGLRDLDAIGRQTIEDTRVFTMDVDDPDSDGDSDSDSDDSDGDPENLPDAPHHSGGVPAPAPWRGSDQDQVPGAGMGESVRARTDDQAADQWAGSVLPTLVTAQGTPARVQGAHNLNTIPDSIREYTDHARGTVDDGLATGDVAPGDRDDFARIVSDIDAALGHAALPVAITVHLGADRALLRRLGIDPHDPGRVVGTVVDIPHYLSGTFGTRAAEDAPAYLMLRIPHGFPAAHIRPSSPGRVLVARGARLYIHAAYTQSGEPAPGTRVEDLLFVEAEVVPGHWAPPPGHHPSPSHDAHHGYRPSTVSTPPADPPLPDTFEGLLHGFEEGGVLNDDLPPFTGTDDDFDPMESDPIAFLDAPDVLGLLDTGDPFGFLNEDVDMLGGEESFPAGPADRPDPGPVADPPVFPSVRPSGGSGHDTTAPIDAGPDQVTDRITTLDDREFEVLVALGAGRTDEQLITRGWKPRGLAKVMGGLTRSLGLRTGDRAGIVEVAVAAGLVNDTAPHDLLPGERQERALIRIRFLRPEQREILAHYANRLQPSDIAKRLSSIPSTVNNPTVYVGNVIDHLSHRLGVSGRGEAGDVARLAELEAPPLPVLTDEQKNQAIDRITTLDDREFEVLVALGAERNDEEILDRPGWKPRGLAIVMGGLTRSLGLQAGDRAGVAAVAVAAGLTNDTDPDTMTSDERQERAVTRIRFLRPEQREVLAHYANGLQPSDIAKRLSSIPDTVSNPTVYIHNLITHFSHRLGVLGREEAGAAARLAELEAPPLPVLTDEQKNQAIDRITTLSDREFEVLVALGAGRTDEQLITRGWKPRGLTNVMGGLTRSLGLQAGDRAGIAELAVAAGLTDDKDPGAMTSDERQERALIRIRFLRPEQREVLAHYANGLKASDIAKRISPNANASSVDGLLTNLSHRLGVSGRGEAMKAAQTTPALAAEVAALRPAPVRAVPTRVVRPRVAPAPELTPEQIAWAVDRINDLLKDSTFQVFVHMGAGLDDIEEIGTRVGLRPHTVTNYISQIVRDLKLNSSKDIVAVAAAAGLAPTTPHPQPQSQSHNDEGDDSSDSEDSDDDLYDADDHPPARRGGGPRDDDPPAPPTGRDHGSATAPSAQPGNGNSGARTTGDSTGRSTGSHDTGSGNRNRQGLPPTDHHRNTAPAPAPTTPPLQDFTALFDSTLNSPPVSQPPHTRETDPVRTDDPADDLDDDFYGPAPAARTQEPVPADPDDPWNGNPPTSLDLSALTAGGKDTKFAEQPFTVGEAVADLADPGYGLRDLDAIGRQTVKGIRVFPVGVDDPDSDDNDPEQLPDAPHHSGGVPAPALWSGSDQDQVPGAGMGESVRARTDDQAADQWAGSVLPTLVTAQGTSDQVQGAPILDITPNQAHSLWEYTDHLRGMVDEGLVTGDVGPEDRDDFAWIVSDIDTALRYAALPVAITVHLGADPALLQRLGIDPHDPGRVVGTVVDIPHYLSGTFGTRAAEHAPAYLMLRIPHGYPAAHIRPSSPGRVLVARGARLYIHAAYIQPGEPAPGTRVEDLLFVEAEVVPGHWAPPPGHHPSPSHDAHHGYRPSTVSTPPADPPLPDTFEGLLHGIEEGGVLDDGPLFFTEDGDAHDPMESDPIAFLDAPDVLGLLDTGDPFGFLNEDVDMLGGEESFPAGPADRPDPGPVADPPVFPSVRPSGGSGHETTAPIDAGTDQVTDRIKKLNDGQFEVLVALGAGRTDKEIIARLGWKPRGFTNVMSSLAGALGLQAGDRAGIAEVAVAAGLTDDKDPGAMTSDERHTRALIRIRFLRPEQHEVLAHHARRLKPSDIAKRVSPNESSVDSLLTSLSHRLGVLGRGEAGDVARLAELEAPPLPVLTDEQKNQAIDRITTLDDREFDLLVALGAERNDKEILDRPGWSRGFSVAMSRLTRSLGLQAGDRAGAAAVAVAAGLTDDKDPGAMTSDERRERALIRIRFLRPEQHEVLAHYANRLQPSDIAKRLSSIPNTIDPTNYVNTSLARLSKRLGVLGRGEAGAAALAAELETPPLPVLSEEQKNQAIARITTLSDPEFEILVALGAERNDEAITARPHWTPQRLARVISRLPRSLGLQAGDRVGAAAVAVAAGLTNDTDPDDLPSDERHARALIRIPFLQPDQRKALIYRVAEWKRPQIAEQLRLDPTAVSHQSSNFVLRLGVLDRGEAMKAVQAIPALAAEVAALRPVPARAAPTRAARTRVAPTRVAPVRAARTRVAPAPELTPEQIAWAVDRITTLSDPQNKIFFHLGAGLDRDGIVARDGLAKRTVDDHIRSIVRDLGLNNPGDAVAVAVAAGLAPTAPQPHNDGTTTHDTDDDSDREDSSDSDDDLYDADDHPPARHGGGPRDDDPPAPPTGRDHGSATAPSAQPGNGNSGARTTGDSTGRSTGSHGTRSGNRTRQGFPPADHQGNDTPGPADDLDDDFYGPAPAARTQEPVPADPDDPWNGNPPTSLDLSALTAGGKDTKFAEQPFTVGEAVADLADPGYGLRDLDAIGRQTVKGIRVFPVGVDDPDSDDNDPEQLPDAPHHSGGVPAPALWSGSDQDQVPGAGMGESVRARTDDQAADQWAGSVLPTLVTAQGTSDQVQGAPILDITPNQAHSLWEYTDHLRGMVDEGLVTGDVGPEDRDDFAWIVSDIDTALRYAALPVAITVHLGADPALLQRLGIDPHDPGRVVGTVVDIPHYLSGTFGTRAAEHAPAYLMLRIPHGYPAAHIRPSSPGRVLVARGARLYIHAAYIQPGEPAPGTRVEDLLFVEAEVVPGHWDPPPGHHPSPSHDAHHGYRPSTVSTPPADPPLLDADDAFDPMESDPIAFLDDPDVLGLLDTGDPFGFLGEDEDVDMLGGEESLPAAPADRPDPGPVAAPPGASSVRPSGGSGHETTAPIDAGTDQVTDRIKKLNDGQFKVLVALGAGRTDKEIIARLGWKPGGLARVMRDLIHSLDLRMGDRAGATAVAVAAGLTDDTAPNALPPGERHTRALIRIRFLRPEQHEVLAYHARGLQPSDIAKWLPSIPNKVKDRTAYVSNVIDHLSRHLGVLGREEARVAALAAELEAPPLPVLSEEQKNQAIDRITTLSSNEFDLLVALGAGRTDKEIAARPKWSPHRLAILMSHLTDSLGLRAGDRTGAAAVAVAAGLTNDTDPDTMTSDERHARALDRIRFLRPEQHEVLTHYASDLQPSDIAKRLPSIPSEVTKRIQYVHNLLDRLSHRLGVRNRKEAGDVAIAAKLEAPPLPVLNEEQGTQTIARINTLSDPDYRVFVNDDDSDTDDSSDSDDDLYDADDHPPARRGGGPRDDDPPAPPTGRDHGSATAPSAQPGNGNSGARTTGDSTGRSTGSHGTRSGNRTRQGFPPADHQGNDTPGPADDHDHDPVVTDAPAEPPTVPPHQDFTALFDSTLNPSPLAQAPHTRETDQPRTDDPAGDLDDDFYGPAPAVRTQEPALADSGDPWNGNPPTGPDLSALIAADKKKDDKPSTVEDVIADLTYRYRPQDIGHHTAQDAQTQVFMAGRHETDPYEQYTDTDGHEAAPGPAYPPGTQVSQYPAPLQYTQDPTATHDASAAAYDQQPAGSRTQAARVRWHGSYDGIEDLVTSAQTGIVEQWEFGEGGGQDELTELVQFGDGTLAVHKVTEDTDFTQDPASNPEYVENALESARQRADAEHLASLVGRAIGAHVPGVYRVGPHELYMHYMDGSSGATQHDHPRPELTRTVSGLRLGLLDILIANSDRNPGNLLYTDEGAVVGIDHGSGWVIEENEPYAPADLGGLAHTDTMETYYDFEDNQWIANPLTARDVRRLERALSALHPEFARLDREVWYNGMLTRLHMLRSFASGTVDLLGGGR